MIIVYETIESKKEKNTFIAYPIAVYRCCNNSMIWFLRYTVDVAVKDQILIKWDLREKPPTQEQFYFCQFCGEKHRFYSNEEFVEMNRTQPEAEELKNTT